MLPHVRIARLKEAFGFVERQGRAAEGQADGTQGRPRARVDECKPARAPQALHVFLLDALTVRPQRRHFAVKPVLLLGERHPGLRHTHIAFERGLTFGAFRKLTAVLGVFPEDV